MRRIYDSEQHQSHYSNIYTASTGRGEKGSRRNVREGNDQDYLFTPDNPAAIEAPDGAILESGYRKTPDIVTNKTSKEESNL